MDYFKEYEVREGRDKQNYEAAPKNILTILPKDSSPDVNALAYRKTDGCLVESIVKKDDCDFRIVNTLSGTPKVSHTHDLIGPQSQFSIEKGGFNKSRMNHPNGSVDICNMNEYMFSVEYLKYRRGETDDNSAVKNDQDLENGGNLESDKGDKKGRKRVKCTDPTSTEFNGPWAALPDIHKNIPVTTPDANENVSRISKAPQPVTVLHVEDESWFESPIAVDKESAEQLAKIPKRQLFQYIGHSMGVQRIKLFPKTEHLLLSCSMDATVKIWECFNRRRMLRTYLEHSQAVRDIDYVDDGMKFLTSSYDKTVILWDTEYGKIINKFIHNDIPYCVAAHPTEPSFITGLSNRKALQYDIRTATVAVEYNDHLGAVNTVTFCESGRRLMTTSDDRKLRIWDYGIPIVHKHISDPAMFSVPAVVCSPNSKFFAAQSMDNRIVVYEATGRFRLNTKKSFGGHMNSGYAIQPGISTDNRYIVSGDTCGRLWLWDWKNCRNLKTFDAHSGVCMDTVWYNTHPSRMVTCGWDGLIKIWE